MVGFYSCGICWLVLIVWVVVLDGIRFCVNIRWFCVNIGRFSVIVCNLEIEYRFILGLVLSVYWFLWKCKYILFLWIGILGLGLDCVLKIGSVVLNEYL